MNSNSFLLYANWKMNKNPNEVRSYIRQITKLIKLKDQKKIIFLAPALTLFVLQEECTSSLFSWGAQNCYFKDSGAFTGENSPLVLKQMGITHCLVGHSERRTLFLEDEQLILKKVQALLQYSIQPILCVGETSQERKSGKSFEVIKKQLSLILKLDNLKNITIAYEPIWAIGNKQSADVVQILEMQQYIKKLCGSKKLCFLYGGSVNIQNAKKISQIQGVNGFLIGSASLNPHDFFKIFNTI